MSVLDDLKQMETMLTGDGKWIQGVEAQRADGSWTIGENPEAVCWCMIGAMAKVSGDMREDAASGRYQQMQDAIMDAMANLDLPYVDIPEFNDDPRTKQEDVLNVVRYAIKTHGGE